MISNKKSKGLKLIISLMIFISLRYPLYAQDIERPDNSADMFIQSGVSKLNSNDYKNAIEDFRNALKISPNNKDAKKYLAISLNNYALMVIKEDKIDNAISYLEESVKLLKDEVAKKNLSGLLLTKATNLYNKHELNDALSYANKSFNILVDNFEALRLMGDIYYDLEKLDEAILYYSKAKELKPLDEGLAKTLDRLKNEKALKSSFKDIPSDRFIIRYEKETTDFDYYQFRPILNEAYRIIGQDLNLFPNEKIVVIIYSEESYKKLKSQPSSVTGLFDGKIHIPLRSNVKDLNEYKSIVYHEYTHALIFNLTLGRCPVWLNEGLAEYEESRVMPVKTDILKTALKNNSLINITSLDEVFLLIKSQKELTPKEQGLMMLAYEEAYTLARYILHRFTRAHLQRIFSRLRMGVPIHSVLKSELYLTVEQLQKQWIEYLKQNYQ
ncbi:MAG: tetratricopeptide repeat protein [Candidatus Omnitrophica bacterium]|nr:tetratricopeptide repeat protein [Candidatus Omnitrophota bacterium]